MYGLLKTLKNLCQHHFTSEKRKRKNRFLQSVCYYHVTYEFQSESTLYSVPECQGIPCSKQAPLSDSNEIRTHNHLVRKRTLNHLASFAKWLSVRLQTKWLSVRISLLSLKTQPKFVIANNSFVRVPLIFLFL